MVLDKIYKLCFIIRQTYLILYSQCLILENLIATPSDKKTYSKTPFNAGATFQKNKVLNKTALNESSLHTNYGDRCKLLLIIYKHE